MKSIIIASLIALALAASPATFVPKNEYVYKFDGLILSGLPTSASETSQTRVQCRALLQIIDDRSIHLQLSEVRIAASHLPESEQWPKLESLEKRELSSEHQQLLESPVRAQLRHGLVSDTQFSNEDAEWSKNLKRSILNLISLRRTAPIDEMTEQPLYKEDSTDDQFFTVNEKTIEGDCQVAYSIIREEKQTVYTKSVNFDRCIYRPQAAYGLRFASPCEECENRGELVKPQTVYTYIIEEDKLQQVEVRSTYILNVKGEEVVKSETRSKLVLEEERKINNEIKKVNGEKEDIIYSAKWEQLIENFFKNGDKAEVSPFEEYPTEKKMDQVRSIVEQLQENEQNKPETAHLLARLVRLFRMCTIEELKKIHQTVYDKAEKKVQYIFDSAFAIAGTKNTIQNLIHHIEKKTVTPLRASQLLKSIQETQYPSEKIADLLVELARSPVAKEHEVLRQSAWLAAGSIVRGTVSKTLDLPFVSEKKRETKEKFVRVFMQHFRQAESTYEKVLALKTIGNAGIDLSVNELSEIILDQRQPLSIRTEAVEALRLLKDIMPRKIQKVLLPVYKNRRNAPELRMSALWRIMQTIPEEPVLSQIAIQMEKESNQHVAAFTYNVLRQVGKSTNPCNQQLAATCSKILLLTRYQPQEQLLSTFAQLPIFNADSGIQFDFATIFEKNSFLPKEVHASLETILGGNWNKHLAQVGFSQQNFEGVFISALEKLSSMNVEGIFKVRQQKGLQMLKELAKKMNIRARLPTDRSKNPHAVFYLRYKEMDFVVLPIEKETVHKLINKYVQDGELDIQSVRKMLNHNQDFELHTAAFIYEATRTIPTTFGWPLTISGKVPTVLSVGGEATVELGPLEARFILNVRPSIVSTHVTQMRLWTPLFEQGVKSLQTVRAFTPLKIELTAGIKNSKIELVTKVTVPQEKKTVLAVNTRPVAFLRFPTGEKYEHVEAEEKTIVVPQWQLRSEEVEKFYEVLGLKIAIRGNFVNQWNVPAMIHTEQDLEMTLETKSRPVEYTARLNLLNVERVDLSEIKFDKVFEKEFDTEERETENRREYFHKMISEMKRGPGYKFAMTLKLDAPQDKYFKTELSAVCEHFARICKFEIDTRRSPIFEDENKEWTLRGELVSALPKLPASLRQLREQPHREVQLSLNAKWGSNKKSEIIVNAQVQQSKEQKKYIRNIEREFNGLPEYELLIKAARLNQINAVAQYKLTPENEYTFSRLFDIVKAYNFWTLSESRVNNEERRATLELTVVPTSRQYLNMTVQTPEQTVTMRNVRIPRVTLPTIAQRSFRQQALENTGSSCKIDNTEVRTFDNMVYRAPITTCYSLLAKDCSEEPKFAVFAKKMNKKSDDLSLKVIRKGRELIVEKKNDEFLVKLGSNKLTENQFDREEIEVRGDNLIVIRLPEGEVRFDGYTIKTLVPTVYSNWELCGLCGNNDGESDNEFYTADNYKTEDVEEFHRSYLLQDEECEIENERLSEKKSYSKRLNTEQKSDSEYETEEQNDEEDKNENGLVKRTAIKEFSHRVCFSIEPVNQCRKGYEVEETVSKKIRYTCMPRHSKNARRFLKEAREEIVPLSEYPVSFVDAMKMPTVCVA